MKSFSISLLAIFFAFSVFAQENEKVVKSEIKSVTVFLSGAQVTRTASATLPKGTTNIVLEDLPQQLNANSIQVKGLGNFTILSVVHQLNYLKSEKKNKDTKVLEDSIKMLQQKVEFQKAVQRAYVEEQNMILANKAIGGQQTGVKVTELQAAADFFRNRLIEIAKNYLECTDKINSYNEIIYRIQSQLGDINARKNIPVSEIVITCAAKEATQASLEVSYAVYNAGWQPSYDLRSKDVNNPVSLNFKANVYQSSGEDWKNVDLTLSTGNPSQSGIIPVLNPWYVNFTPSYKQDGFYLNQANSRMVMAEKAKVDAPAATKGEALAMPMAGSSASYTTVSESQTNIEYNISIPYTILSNGKQYSVEVQTYQLPAIYEYYCVPKLDKDAFLKARITGWDQYNLISGEVNLFYEDTYVGKSYLNTRSTNDTLDVSLGRDKGIVVTRIMLKEFSSKKVIGANRTDTYGYEISVRNKKKQNIVLVVEDQFPISQISEIEVNKIEQSGATYNDVSGKLTWRFNLAPSETKTVKFIFSIKYPKNKPINL